jgi:uncharacterized protein YyaL (SSP411 family)
MKFISLIFIILIAFFMEGMMHSNEASQATRLNHLAKEKSPYLIQHADNPVDWFPWGEEAFNKAKKEDKPAFLSIGYSTCHWCHVMARESFEDEAVAELLNKYFVAIKVDREERPDIDTLYMSACRALTGRGGWPLSIFMTPEGKPFYAGSYFPKEGRLGLPGFMEILNSINGAWIENRSGIIAASEKVSDAIRLKSDLPTASRGLSEETLKTAFQQLQNNFDKNNGGFGSAPKFPTPHQLTFLLRWHKRKADPGALKMVEKTLVSMRKGGLYDQIGFGFHRYSVDPIWLVPHFEKMLYDQAMLAIAYTEAFQVTGDNRFEKTAKEIFTYVLRDMTSPDGGFFSAEDADSEGEEGLFYVWTPEEIKKHLGNEMGKLVCSFYGIDERGNFEGRNSIAHIPELPERFAKSQGISLVEFEDRLENARERLFQTRKQRTHPLKDDKILTAWNGLMIVALAKASRVFGDPTYAAAAKASANFILKHLKTKTGRLLCRYRNGDAANPGFLDDYAFFGWGLIELYEATFNVAWLEEAIAINKDMLDIFWDAKAGGLFFTGKGNEALITLSKEIYDGAIPSGNSVAALNLIRLGRMTGDVNLERKAEQLVKTFSNQIIAYPAGYTQFLSALDFMVGPVKEIVIAGNDDKATEEIVSYIHQKFMPNTVVLLKYKGESGKKLASVSPFVEAMTPVNNKPTVYVCEQYTCKEPVTDISRLKAVFKY